MSGRVFPLCRRRAFFRRISFSVSGSPQIISSSQPGDFEEVSSDGGTAADKTCGFVFAVAQSNGKRAASPHTAALASRHRRLSEKSKSVRIRQSRAVDKTVKFGYNFIVVLNISGCSAVGSALALGARCRVFESPHSDHEKVPQFLYL